MPIVTWSNRIIQWCFYLLVFIVPLALTPWNYELFEYNKMMVVYGLTVIILAAWISKMIAKRQISVVKTPLDLPIWLFTGSQLVSTLFSIDPHVSWFGYYSRFNGGMWSVLSYVTLYYAFVSNWHDIASSDKKPLLSSTNSSIKRLIGVALTTGGLVALYGALERMGIDKHLWVQDVQSRVFSTLGQPNWLAAYLVALSPLTWEFAINAKWPTSTSLSARMLNAKLQIVHYWKFWFWSALSGLFFFVLLNTRSRSGLLAYAVAVSLYWVLRIFKAGKNRLDVIKPSLLLGILLFLVVFFNGTFVAPIDRWITLGGITSQFQQPTSAPQTPSPEVRGPALEVGGTESGTIRKYVWQAAIFAWRSSVKTFLIGTGTETFAWTFFQFRPAEHNLVSEWDFLYNKAHNEYLNYLATTGSLGLGSYLLFLVGVCSLCITRSVKKTGHPDDPDTNEAQGMTIAFLAGWTSILVTNFFGFSVVVVQLFLFLFPAMVLVLHPSTLMSHRTYKLGLPSPWPGIFLTSAWCLAGYVLLTVSVYWWADTLYATGNRYSNSEQYALAHPDLVQATSLNPGEPVYHDELAIVLANLAVFAAEDKDASKAAELAKSALTQSDIAIVTSPKNVNFWKNRTKIFYLFANFDAKFNAAAIEALNQAYTLSPHDPKILYNLAVLYGQDKQNDKAIELLLEAKGLKPNYRDIYYALHVFYNERGSKAEARAVLQEYLDRIDPGDTDFLGRITSL